MHTLQEALAKITAESGQIDSLIAYNDSLRQQVKDALASHPAIPPELATQIDAIFDASSANADKVQAALNANTAAQGVNPVATAPDVPPSAPNQAPATAAAPQPATGTQTFDPSKT